ncbi:hypothetical protein IL306_012366 [Fusarium sp. DS 682]|nr:hypothetical protein IL306_012366 [Fusarium sp. DS 682]
MPDSTIKSLHSLSVENPRFAVRPLFWTSQHLTILNCNFQQIDDSPDHTAKLPAHADEEHTQFAAYLAKRCAPDLKVFYDSLLHHPKGGRLEFVRQHANPIIGSYYYNADQKRRDRLKAPVAPRGRNNDPVKRLYDRRLRNVTPDDWRNDPYLVCLLLSLAQVQWRRVNEVRPSLFQVRLLVTNKSDTAHAYVFVADIPYQLLESLDHPTRSIDWEFPTINWIKVAFKPHSTFPERILLHLVGNDGMVTVSAPSGQKRRDDEPDQPVKKVGKEDMSSGEL